jgi:hypothetical protein
MVRIVGKAFSNALSLLLILLSWNSPASAHEQEIHQKMSSMSVDFLKKFRPADLPDQCVLNVKERLKKGAYDEDEPFPSSGPVDRRIIGPFYFHFMGDGLRSLDDQPFENATAKGSCNTLQWASAEAPMVCIARLLVGGLDFADPPVESNGFHIAKVILDLKNFQPGTDQHNTALEGLGRYLHLLQDLTSPGHARNDAHPHKWGQGDPSALEYSNRHRGEPGEDSIPEPSVALGLAGFATRNQFFTELRGWTVSRFRSEKDVTSFSGPGPALDHEDAFGYVYDFEGRVIAKHEDGEFVIDDLVAAEQFDELAPEAIRYSASIMDYMLDEDGIRLCPPPNLGERILTFEDLGEGTVLSRCVDAGATLPNCGPGGVDNIYPELTFYSTTAGPKLTGGGEVAVFKTPPPAGLPGAEKMAICPVSPAGGVDCKINLFIKLSPGVSKFAYQVVGGYTLRGFSFDDYNGLLYYGPAGLQTSQSFGSMWRTWESALRQFILNNITGFEFFTTNSHVDTQGLSGKGGLAIDEIRFTP